MDLLDLFAVATPTSVFNRQAWAQDQARDPMPDAGWSQVPVDWYTTWNDDWPDPTDLNRDGSPRASSLNRFIAVHAGAEVWKDAWKRVHKSGHDLERLAQDLLVAVDAIAFHPQGTVERFETFLDLWNTLALTAPEAVARAWKRAHWLTVPQRPRADDDRSDLDEGLATPAVDPLPSSEPLPSWRLRLVDHWLDPNVIRDQNVVPERWGRLWGWVEGWSHDGRLSLDDLVGHRYRNTLMSNLRSAPESRGWTLVWNHGDADAIDVWTRCERAVEGEAANDRQWQTALETLTAMGHRQLPAVPVTKEVSEHLPLPFEDQDRARVWIEWGLRQLKAGDASPLDRVLAYLDQDGCATGPSPGNEPVTLELWKSRGEALAGLPAPDARSALWWAARSWEQYTLRLAAQPAELGDPPAPGRPRARL